MTALTEDEILEDIENYLCTLLPRLKSMDPLTLHYYLSKAIANAMAVLYTRNEAILDVVDPLRATGVDLDHIVASRLLTRYEGDYATGYLTFARNSPSASDVTIPAGTRCQAGDTFFVTTAAGTILAGTLTISVAATAEERGLDGNVAAYTITSIYSSLSGVDSCYNALAFSGGTAEETDTELRARFVDVTTLPGVATLEMIERKLEDLEYVSEAKAFNRSEGDIEIVVDDSLGIATIDTDVVDELEDIIAAGCQARGILAGTATVGGNIAPTTDPISLTDTDCAGGLVWVRPAGFIAAGETFAIDYVTTSGATQTGSAVVPTGTHRGQMVEVTLADEDDRAVSIATKAFTGANAYDVCIGLGEAGYLYNLPTDVTFGVIVNLIDTDTPETGLAANIQASIEAWLGDFVIGERCEWGDLRACATIVYEAATEPSLKHQILGTERVIVGVDRITSFVVSGNGTSITKDGEYIDLENDEIARCGTVTVTVT